jgi:predicted nucleic acid-binding protein
MEKIVVDASVIAKWFIEEEDSEKAAKIRNQFIEGQMELISPNLLHYEVLNALKYSKLFSNEELTSAVTSLENYGIIQVPLNGEYAQKVIIMSLENEISIYDAAYIGLAEILNIKIYTADRRLAKKLKGNYQKRIQLIAKLA